jgi:hypothetical protein
MHGGEDRAQGDAARVIELPRREVVLDEPSERPPAEVIELPLRKAADRPRDTPPRLAV